jgi:hypothetical protein
MVEIAHTVDENPLAVSAHLGDVPPIIPIPLFVKDR